MSKNKIFVNCNKEVINEATKWLEFSGFTLEEAVTLFLEKTNEYHGFPFVYWDEENEVPNDETLEAMKECDDIAAHPENYKGYTDLDEMWADIHK